MVCFTYGNKFNPKKPKEKLQTIKESLLCYIGAKDNERNTPTKVKITRLIGGRFKIKVVEYIGDQWWAQLGSGPTVKK